MPAREGEPGAGGIGQAGGLPQTGAREAAAARQPGARGLGGSRFETGSAARAMGEDGGEDGDGGGDDGETDCAEALVEFQRLVTVAVQKGMMGMSDARVSYKPIGFVETIGARKVFGGARERCVF